MPQKNIEISSQVKSVEHSIKLLVHFYQNQWPCKEKTIKKQLNNTRNFLDNEMLFQLVLLNFKDFINSQLGRHASRYKKTAYFFGSITHVSGTNEFRTLNKIIDSYRSIQSPLEQGAQLSIDFVKGCFNFIDYAIHNPAQALVFFLSMQMLLQPVRADTLGNDFEHLLDTCPNRNSETPLLPDSQTSPAFVRANGVIPPYFSSLKEKPRVVFFGENHILPGMRRMVNRVFPALKEAGFESFGNEGSENSLHEEIQILTKFLSNGFFNVFCDQDHIKSEKELLRLFKNFQQHAVNFYQLDDDEIREWFRKLLEKQVEMHRMETDLLETLDARDQVMAKKISRVWYETQKHVFVLCGVLHSGIAWYLLEAGFDITFISIVYEMSDNAHPIINALFQEKEEMLRHPDFHYLEIPNNCGKKDSTTAKVMEMIAGRPQESEAKLSFFWERYRDAAEASYFSQFNFEPTDNMPPTWQAVVSDAIKGRKFYFFDSQSKVTLHDLGYTDADGRCVEASAPPELCLALQDARNSL